MIICALDECKICRTSSKTFTRESFSSVTISDGVFVNAPSVFEQIQIYKRPSLMNLETFLNFPIFPVELKADKSGSRIYKQQQKTKTR